MSSNIVPKMIIDAGTKIVYRNDNKESTIIQPSIVNNSSVQFNDQSNINKSRKASKPPIVKQNLASKLRMEKANPYMYYKKQLDILNGNAGNENHFTLNLDKTVSDKLSKTLQENSSQKSILRHAKLPKQSTNISKQSFNQSINVTTTKTIFKTKILVVEPSNSKTISNSTFQKPQVYNKAKAKPSATLTKFPMANANSKNLKDRDQISSVKTFVPNITSTGNKKPAKTAPETSKLKPTFAKKDLQFNKVKTKLVLDPIKNPIDTKKVYGNKVVRRSLSAVHFKRMKKCNMNSFILRTQSLENIPPESAVKMKKPITPINEERESVCKTSLAQRRSVVFHTPVSSGKRLFESPHPGKTSAPKELQKRLNDWLEKRGKSLGSFHHLKCFGVDVTPLVEDYDEENKENVEVIREISDSYKDLRIINDAESPNTKYLFSIAKDALYDLQTLILEGYPRDLCESWLKLIRTKYNLLEEQPQYWECRAALEEVRGNFSSAVEYYQKAIVKGAEVKEVDESLENLLKKFSILNLSPEKEHIFGEDKEKKRSKSKTILDARNVFKSSIINFAIQERSLKNKTNTDKCGLKFIATPVRRSTRVSRSNFKSTPGLIVCGSLNELEEPIRQSLQFKSNKALPT